ncbi:MAG: UDP-N-acetylmuramoyl-L-alanyl-D-glutamate--2,6-diaminopimelate ligase [Wenzhouxiangellaceae bacterium]
MPAHVSAIEVSGLCLDSRRIEPGDAFVALPGRARDGMQFAGQALASGAAVVLHPGDSEPPAAIADRCLAVPGLVQRLDEIARRVWDDPAADLDLIAVTGTNGKTSVAWMLARALDGAMIGTLGIGRPGAQIETSHTTPDLPGLYRALARLRDQGERIVVLEASSHALDQGRLAGLSFSSAIFTNLGHDHLDYHQSIEAYGEAKRRLFTEYSCDHCLINLDDPFGAALGERLRGHGDVRSYGMNAGDAPDYLATIRHASLDGMELEIATPTDRIEVRSPLIGRINAYNLAIVAATMDQRGHAARAVCDMLETLSAVPGRMNRVDGPGGQRVIIDYAHTPDALANALTTLREVTPGRLICVFGCGGERDQEKRPRMGKAAESLADINILTDDNPRGEDSRRILRAIQSGMARPDRCRVMPDRERAIVEAVSLAEPGDCVLVAGKGHEVVQELDGRTLAFSDFEVVRRALAEAA